VTATVTLIGTFYGEGANTASTTVQIINPKLYIIDPYLSPFNGSTSISQQTVISSLSNYSAVQATGMITDGTATAIAVYQTGVNTPVTFTGTDGVQFESWNPQFLNYPPSYGNCGGQCYSSPVNPIQGSDGSYYAFALLLAPKQTSSVTYTSQAVSVTASITINNQKTVSPPVQLGIGPTPVVFVHGLWGDKTSLSTISSSLQLTQPWGEGAVLYQALSTFSYSKTLAFDADSGPNSGTSALAADIQQTTVSLDGAHFVGGRIDVVAHSMGGLVVRHYSSLPTPSTPTIVYQTPRSRMQGLFRTVVTIDTPEIGSALAPFLVQPEVANGTCNTTFCPTPTLLHPVPFPVGTPGKVWELFCLSAQTPKTLATCFAKHGDPLGPPGLCTSAGSASCGAVASLAPNSPNIEVLPSANIPNSQWFAIGSDWVDNGTSPEPSELRSLLNDLLAAIALPHSPTLSNVLGDPNNDVIVTTSSQFWDTNRGQTVEFPYLAHTALPFLANILPLGSTSNSSVTTSPAVASCVAQILLNSSTSGCSTSPGPQVAMTERGTTLVQQSEPDLLVYQGETKEDAEKRNAYPLRFAPERMSVNAPEGDVPMGIPIDLRLTFAPGTLVGGTLSVVQNSKSGSQSQGSGLAKIVLEEGSTKTIQITPVQIGPVDVEIDVVYSDNSFVRQSAHLNVVPSAKGLTKFSLDQGTHFMALVLEDEEKDRQQLLRPMVTYEGVKFPIYLDDSSQIKLSVEEDEGNPVARVDGDGTVHALREGTAVVVGDFDGVIDRIQVTVYSKEDAPVGYRTVIR
jgi:pimeloyl-ACP methyl ester carboxylesterase